MVQAVWVLTSLPGDADAHSSLRTAELAIEPSRLNMALESYFEYANLP